jgi:NAD(P)-dependent dehydrogenase (short-subunit alcohol dehydrogenase family)
MARIQQAHYDYSLRAKPPSDDRSRTRLHPWHASLEVVAQPDDIAEVVAFLASPNARWVNGESVRVDGGSKL